MLEERLTVTKKVTGVLGRCGPPVMRREGGTILGRMGEWEGE